jgi:hypothetical protein
MNPTNISKVKHLAQALFELRNVELPPGTFNALLCELLFAVQKLEG